MPTDTVAAPRDRAAARETGSTGPWDEVCAALTDALAERAGRHPGTPPAVVVPLGRRDELAAGPAEFAADAVPVGLYGHHAVVGPPTVDGGPGCPGCLARRWQSVRAGFLRDAIERDGETRATGIPPWQADFVADALSALVAAAARHPRAARHPWVWLLDLETLHVARFPLVPDGECPSCGSRPDDTAEAARITLDSSPKHAPDGFRLRPLHAYDLVPEAFANPVTGMLGPSVVPDLTSASTSSTVGAFTTRSGDYLRECYWGGHTGTYDASVRVGLLEGLERYAGMRARAKRPVVTAALDDLGDTAVDPRVTGLYSDAFHAADPDAPRFAPDRPVRWVWGWSLREDRPVLVPEVVAYYHAPGGIQRRFVQESSNGCASGGSLAEAVYHGLMETIERDAFLLAWFGRARLPEIDPSSSTRPATRAMVARLAMYGYRARFFDTRVTFPVPVVTAVAERVDGGPGLLCFGAGASLDPEDALAGGLCEIATDSVNLRRRTAREERRLRRMAEDFGEVRVLHDHPLLYGLPEMGPYTDFLLRGRDVADRVPLSSLASGPGALPASADLRDDVAACVDAVTARGFDVVVVDQTVAEQRALGFHTVKVLVPGLIPIDFGWNRQRGPLMPRARTALREAGLRADDLPPDGLNPAPHPFP
ncbi:TOMM precursor leader peptide-binding protein [Streptomyces sp. NBC_01571]|uniref:TOMM precursor leader peptide-binding protein n=1 Tax=Streptomyces sp. NBC_01571 TaxID=2975883 RepID=UPI002253912A|nr:TOMM precursor leader peptide-binding protein [Streptomyces sp. NBC_01571]MCX4580669.1 TOMM precursor leader peptide-binding protein [Streptomyces sp. NBC_01571]